MTETLKVKKIGDSLGIILPKELLLALDVKEGDDLYAVHTPEGVLLNSHDAEFEQVLESVRDFMRRHSDAMKKLADS